MEELITHVIAKTRELCKNSDERPDIEDLVAREAHVKLIENKVSGGYKIESIKFIGMYAQVIVTETEIAYKPDRLFPVVLYTYRDWNALLAIDNASKALEVGRIEYLSNKGKVGACTEYLDKDLMVAEIKECLDCGIPINIVLYKDKNGKTMSKEWVEDLDCMPAGFQEIDYPY
jgi:hypothetical protein